MRVTQIRNSSNSIAASLKTTGFKQLLAVGSVAIGIAAIIPAAPAQAASLAGGSLNFGGAVSDFYFDPTSSQPTFSVNFNVGSALTNVTQSTGPFQTAVPVRTYTNPPAPVTFSRIFAIPNGVNSFFQYSNTNNLVFNFQNGTTFTIPTGSFFNGTYTTNAAQTVIQGMNFTLGTNSSYYTNNGTRTNTDGAAFSFSDTPANTNGVYSAPTFTLTQPVPQSVPEPFSIIGTLVGGTAAFRMRKKLSAANKK